MVNKSRLFIMTTILNDFVDFCWCSSFQISTFAIVQAVFFSGSVNSENLDVIAAWSNSILSGNLSANAGRVVLVDVFLRVLRKYFIYKNKLRYQKPN